MGNARHFACRERGIMIKVAIVDDEKRERDELEAYYRRFQKETQEEIKTVCFSSGEEILQIYDSTFDIICLDIDMQGKDGINTAKEIRSQDDQVIIIFITNMAQMAIKGYEVHALDFVLKPVNYFSFAMKMQTAVSIAKNRKSRNIVISTLSGMQKISTNDLLYAEIDGHYLYYHTTQGDFRQKASLSELEEKLQGLSFKRCNNCYLINLKHVDGVEKDDLKIAGKRLKISRPRKKEFLQALANYMGGICL